MAVGVRHQLIGFLGGGIQADGMVDRVGLGKRHLDVAAVHAGAARVHQVRGRVVAAGLQDVDEAHQIRLGVGVRVGQ